MNDLVRFWNECDLDSPPYIHPRDAKLLKQRAVPLSIIRDHSAFVAHETFGAERDTSLHVNLLPVPYQGNLAAADIFIVLLNPGLGMSDYQTQADPAHSTQIRKIIRQEFDEVPYPFLSLNPEFAWSGGFGWWMRKLNGVVRQAAKNDFNENFEQALRHLSSRTAAIEMFPYHSRSFGVRSIADKLPSVLAARAFVAELIERAKSGEITVIIPRALWATGVTDHGLVHHNEKLVRTAPLGPESAGGKAILDRLKQQPMGLLSPT